jgi:hypothetical protein
MTRTIVPPSVPTRTTARKHALAAVATGVYRRSFGGDDGISWRLSIISEECRFATIYEWRNATPYSSSSGDFHMIHCRFIGDW